MHQGPLQGYIGSKFNRRDAGSGRITSEKLNGWAADNGAQLPTIPPECEQSYHIFYLILPSIDRGQALISHLLQREILVVFHYLPLHLSPMGRHFGGCEGDCPITEKIADRLLRLPFYTGMTDLGTDTGDRRGLRFSLLVRVQ